MSNMLGNGSLTHGDAMDVEESSNFQFSKEPSLEKMWARCWRPKLYMYNW